MAEEQKTEEFGQVVMSQMSRRAAIRLWTRACDNSEFQSIIDFLGLPQIIDAGRGEAYEKMTQERCEEVAVFLYRWAEALGRVE